MTFIDEDLLPNLAPDAPWRTDKRLRREMLDRQGVGGIIRVYYTIGALASALGKETVTIRRWVRLGVIPDAQFTTSPVDGTINDSGLRLWKEEQICMIVTAAHECGILRQRCQSLANTGFKEVLAQRWLAQGWPLC